jgi:hypothetical protein
LEAAIYPYLLLYQSLGHGPDNFLQFFVWRADGKRPDDVAAGAVSPHDIKRNF